MVLAISADSGNILTPCIENQLKRVVAFLQVSPVPPPGGGTQEGDLIRDKGRVSVNASKMRKQIVL
jgi:hypothetical protein